MAGENNTKLFSWNWPEDDEWILQIVTSLVDMTILSIMNAAICWSARPQLENLRALGLPGGTTWRWWTAGQ